MIRQAFLTLGVLAVVGILAPWSLTQLRTRHALEDWNAWVALLTYAGCVALLIRLRVTVWGRRRDRRMRHRARWIAVIVLAAAAGASLRVADFYSTYGTSWNWGREGGPSCTRIVLKRW
jgi:drug/metabolite transporter (DMT)-like permease